MEPYDANKLSKHITWEDTNNLYWYAMPKPLATGEFKSIDIEDSDLDKYRNDIPKECISEVDF